jgi:cell division protein ZapE
VVWFDFKHAVRWAALAERLPGDRHKFHTVLLSNVPQMPVRMASEARRFTWLVDVLYDRRVKLIISAAVFALSSSITEGPLAHEFPRTVSRLNEMQSVRGARPTRRQCRSRFRSPQS